MSQTEAMEIIFAGLFFTANKLQSLADRYLASENITSRQWLLMAVIHKSPGGLASIGEAAQILCTSHQNIKQMANLLHKNGWIEWAGKPGDKRFLCMKQTEMCRAFWQKREKQDWDYLQNLFNVFDEKEQITFASLLLRFYESMGGQMIPSNQKEQIHQQTKEIL